MLPAPVPGKGPAGSALGLELGLVLLSGLDVVEQTALTRRA
jgi:hypothetical protein